MQCPSTWKAPDVHLAGSSLISLTPNPKVPPITPWSFNFLHYLPSQDVDTMRAGTAPAHSPYSVTLSGSLLSSWVHAWRTPTQPSKPISSRKPAQPTHESDVPLGTLWCPGLSHRVPHHLAVCGCLPTQHDSMRPGPWPAPSLSAQNKAMASRKGRSAGLQTDNIRGAVEEGSGRTVKIWPSKCW